MSYLFITSACIAKCCTRPSVNYMTLNKCHQYNYNVRIYINRVLIKLALFFVNIAPSNHVISPPKNVIIRDVIGKCLCRQLIIMR